RTGDKGSSGSHLQRPLQSQRTGSICSVARYIADSRGPLHAPGGSNVLLPGSRPARRPVRHSCRMGEEGHFECRRLRKVLKRPHDYRICRGYLEGGTMSHTVETQRPRTGGEPALSPLAGKPAPKEMLIDVARLEREYFERRPDLSDRNQLVS